MYHPTSRTASLIVAIFSGLFAWGCADEKLPQQATPREVEGLTILTPHNTAIRQAFELGFSEWCRTKRQADIRIDWLVMGTPQCIDYIERTVSGVDDGKKRRMPDIMFGGGVADHDKLAQRGYSRSLKLDDVVANLPAEVNGLATRDPQGRWFATGLSSFGIFYNRDACNQRGIEPPTGWSDLADPRYLGWVGIADPGASGSNRQAMMLILQNQGWDAGWATILRTLANCRALHTGSSDVLNEIGHGLFLAGFAVNFDALPRVEAGEGRLAYIDPPGATAAMPDIVSALKSAGDAALGEEFVRYCLSEAGQKAWSVDAALAGSAAESLYHYPIDPSIYKTYAGHLSVRENPFDTDFGVRVDPTKATRQAEILIPLVEAACGKNHIQLQRAWQAVIAAQMKPEALALLIAAPLDEAAAYAVADQLRDAAPEDAEKLRAEWSALFAKRYADVLALCSP